MITTKTTTTNRNLRKTLTFVKEETGNKEKAKTNL